ncbi:MAG: hypothetical protein KJO07_17660 [Deltaproteobacteria bacterium]|nr:hypothetical protein [Deltaproteobacteria bacterium]
MLASFIGLVSVALSLSGFGVSPNPNAPVGAAVLAYAPSSADVMIYVDVEAVAPRNFKALVSLADDPAMAQAPELRRELKSAVGQLQMGLGMVRGATGLDLVNDVKSVALWLQFPLRGEPNLLIHVRGNFPSDLIGKIANASGQQVVRVARRQAIRIDGKMLLTTARDGSLLFGTPRLVKRRARSGPRRARARGGVVGVRARRLLDRKPFFAMVSSPSRTALGRLSREFGRQDNALSDLISGHRFAGFAMYSRGVEWSYVAKKASGIARAKMASQGILQLMRASHLAGRGLANLLLSAVDSYRGQSPEIDSIIKAKPQILELIEQFTGDGKFNEKITIDRRARSVRVTAYGRSLSDVMPFAGALPLGAGVGWLMLAH